MTPPPYSLASVESLLDEGCVVLGGRPDVAFTRAAPVDRADALSLSWIRADHPRRQAFLDETQAGIVVCPPGLDTGTALAHDVCLIVSPHPKATFSRIASALLVPPRTPGIHPTAVIDPAARIGLRAEIGATCVAGAVEVGDDVVLEAGCVLHDGVRLGHRVRVGSGSVLGAEGFSYDRLESGELVRFPHLGGLVIEDDVDIQSLVTIDRGSLADTIVRRGARIDSHAYVPHNCDIGEHCLLIGTAMLGGGVRLGRACWIGPGVVIRDGLSVGDGAFVGMGAVVTRDVAAGAIVMGSPARPVEEQKALPAALRRAAL